MTASLLDLGACTCAVVASNAVAERMRAYLDPFVIADYRRRPDVTVSIACDPRAVDITRHLFSARPPIARRTAHPGQHYSVWTVEDHEVLLPDWVDNHVVDTAPGYLSVTADDCGTAATIGTRVVRQLIMRGSENRGAVAVHAGSVSIDGNGLLIGGRAGAGKTTMLTALLEQHAVPVSGDRTMVIGNGSGWRALGVPLAWRLTPEGLSGSRPLAQMWPRLAPARGTALVDGKAELTPEEIGQIFGQTPTPAATVRRIVVLDRSPQPPAPAADGWFLRRHMGFGRDDSLGADWLNLFPRGPGDANGNDTEWWSRLAASVPVLALSWTHPGQLPALAATIREWIES